MAGKIKKLLENELVGGTQSSDVYPVTSIKAVYDEDNERLDNIINRRGVVNISTNYNSDHIAEVLTLSQAIAKVPSRDRVLGFTGKYLSDNGWTTIEFVGDSITDWANTSKWTSSNLAEKVMFYRQMGIDADESNVQSLEGLLSFRFYPTVKYLNRPPSKISYFYNNAANNGRFLLQFYGSDDSEVAQCFMDAKHGIDIINITDITTAAIVGEAVIDFDKVSTQFSELDIPLLGSWGTPTGVGLLASSEGVITGVGEVTVSIVEDILNMFIPQDSYVYSMGTLSQIKEDFVVSDYKIPGIAILVYDLSVNNFKIIKPRELSKGAYIKCGQFNTYLQNIIFNCTAYNYNGMLYTSEYNTHVSVLSNLKFWKNPLNSKLYSAEAFKVALAIKEIRVVGGDRRNLLNEDGTYKDLYITNIEKWWGLGGTPNITISDSEGNVVASTTETINGATRGAQTFCLHGNNKGGLQIMVSINWESIPDTHYAFGTELPLNVSYLYHSCSISSPTQPWWLNPTRGDFDYSMIKEIKLVNGRKEDLIDGETGKPYRTFLSFIRILTPELGGTNYSIIQFIKKVDDNPGVNNVAIATTNTPDVVNDEGILSAVARGVNGTNLQFRVVIDYNKFIDSGMKYNGEDLGATLELNTAYFIAQLEDRPTGALQLSNLNILCLGDSITEFKDNNGKGYVEYLSNISGANVYRGGIGGTRLSSRVDVVDSPENGTQAYAALDIVNVVKALCSQDWTTFDAGIQYVKDNSGNDNTAIANTLKSLDMSKINIITVFGGTNDLTGGSDIGTVDSTDVKTICGAVNEMIRLINQTYPHIKLYFFSPIVRYLDNTRDDEHWSDNWNNNKFPNYIQTISECVRKNHIPFCNWYWDLGWTKYNFSNYFNDNDGTHPYKGFESLALRMNAFISSNIY